MSQHDDFDRSLAQWFDAEARPAATADVLDRSLRATRRRRPRPRLFAALGSDWVGDGVGSNAGVATPRRTAVRASMATYLLLFLLVLALVAGAVLVGARLIQPTPVDLGIFAPVAGRIVYGDGRGIWGVDPAAPADPATRVPLTSHAGSPLGWSSDGTRLLIRRGDELFVLQSDGSEIQVTDGLSSIAGATISPDGSRVVFAGVTSGTGSALYAIDADGGPAERLHAPGEHEHLVQQPTFSPDGTRIAYAIGGGDHSNSVWLMDADGSDAHPIVRNESNRWPGHVRGLAWSPVGDRLALGLGGKIYTFAPDGSDRTQIAGADTSCGGDDPCALKLPKSAESPYWSPDGSQIGYTTDCIEGAGAANQAGCSLAIADADGSKVRMLGSATSGPWHPAPQQVPLVSNLCQGGTRATDLRTLSQPVSTEPRWVADPPPMSARPIAPREIAVVGRGTDGESSRGVYLLDVATGSNCLLVELPPGQSVGNMMWAPSGDALALRVDGPDGGEGVTVVWSSLGITASFVGEITGPSSLWAPDGSSILTFGGSELTPAGLRLVPADGSTPLPFKCEPGRATLCPAVPRVHWSPAGSHISLHGGDRRAPALFSIAALADRQMLPLDTGFGGGDIAGWLDADTVLVASGDDLFHVPIDDPLGSTPFGPRTGPAYSFNSDKISPDLGFAVLEPAEFGDGLDVVALTTGRSTTAVRPSDVRDDLAIYEFQWAPTSDTIAFALTSELGVVPGLWVVDRDGTGLRQVSTFQIESFGGASTFAWRPAWP